ncbi:MAG: S41 family peptidase [Bacteroidales bacterium]|nr:S41 family peptidase [Candidatus Cacconaster caballi]
MKRLVTLVLAVATLLPAGAQSRNFQFGKSLEIQYSVLKEISRSYVDTVNFEKMMDAGLSAMLSTLDPYTVFIPEEDEEDLELITTGNYGGIGALIKKRPGEGVVITEPYDGSPAVKYGIAPGDTIVEIDGKPVFDETSEQSSGRMKGQPGTEVRFKIIRGRTGAVEEIAVVREKIHIPSVEYAGIIRDSIGYMLIKSFTDKVSGEAKEALEMLKGRGARRLVIDLRGNGGGVMDEAVNLVGLFVPKGTPVVSSKGRMKGMDREYLTTVNPVDTTIPILVMVNSGSASASEITAGALQDLDRGTIAGKRTFGKGLIQTIKPVVYNGSVKVTTGKYYTPSGRCVQAIDYSHRNEDGSVGNIPDSLRHAFKTVSGRTVYDGGGITPDIEVESPLISRPTVSLVYMDIPGDYAVEFYKTHPQIAPAESFHLTDEQYEDFVKYASKKEFDARSAAQTVLDQLVKAARQEDLYEQYKAEIEALASKVNMDKETILRVKKDEIKPIVEQEIILRYYYTAAAAMAALRTDRQLYDALDKWD